MTRITVDVNDEWLKATQIVAAFDSVPMDFSTSDRAWGYGGGRDLSRLVEDAHTTGGTDEAEAA